MTRKAVNGPKTNGPKPRTFIKQRRTTSADVSMGQRIRLRRTELGISQSELGNKLGLSFQQVQKYEKGVNRVGAARLDQIAGYLQVPVTFFYENGSKPSREVESLLFLDSAFSLKLLRAYTRIKNPAIQRSIVALMQVVAGEEDAF